MNKIMDILLEIDRIANWTMGGDRRETISSRMGRNMQKIPFAYYGCKLLEILFFDKNHCEEAKQDIDNLKSKDHPVIFLIFFIGIAYALLYITSHFVDKLS